MSTGVPSSTQLSDFERLKWLCNNGYWGWWGGGTPGGSYPLHLIQNWEDVLFYIGNSTSAGDSTYRCPTYSAVNAWKVPAASPPSLTAVGNSNADGTVNVVLTWSDSLNGKTGYRIYKDSVIETTRGPTVTTYTDTAVDEDEYHPYIVAAYKTRNRWFDGASETLESRSTTRNVRVPLRAPTGFTVTNVSRTGADITFTDNSTVEGVYEVYRNNVLVLSSVLGADPYTTGVRTWRDMASLTSGVNYTWKVRVVKADTGNSSSFATPVTVNCPYSHDAPTDITATDMGYPSIYVAWTAGTNDPAWSTVLERQTISDSVWEVIATLGVDNTSYWDSVPDHNGYYYRVKHQYGGTSTSYATVGSVVTV